MKRKVLGKRTTLTSPLPNDRPDNVADFEDWVVRKADYFTMVRRIGPGKYDRQEFNILKYAIKAKGKDPQGMVYAVIQETGRSVMIAPKDYARALEVRDGIGIAKKGKLNA